MTYISETQCRGMECDEFYARIRQIEDECNRNTAIDHASALGRDCSERPGCILGGVIEVVASSTAKYDGSEFGFTSVDFDPAEAARWEVGRNRGGEI